MEHRGVGFVDDAVLLVERDRGDVHLALGGAEGFGKEEARALGLQLGFWDDADAVVGIEAVDADDFTALVGDADEAEFEVVGFGGELGGEASGEAFPPDVFGDVSLGVDAGIFAGAHEAFEGGGAGERDEQNHGVLRARP